MYLAAYSEHLLREGRRHAAYIDITEDASLGLTSAAGAARPRDGGDALLVGHLASEEGRDGARIRSTKINITKLGLNTVSDRVVLCCPLSTSHEHEHHTSSTTSALPVSNSNSPLYFSRLA